MISKDAWYDNGNRSVLGCVLRFDDDTEIHREQKKSRWFAAGFSDDTVRSMARLDLHQRLC